MTWLLDCYDVLFRPSIGLARVADQTKLDGAILSVLIVGALLGIQAAAVTGGSIAGGALGGAILAAAGWFAGGSLWYAATGMVGAEGSLRNLLAALGWASLPLLLLPVVASFGRWWGTGAEGLLKLGVFVWATILAVRAVCRAMGLSTGRSIGSLALIAVLLMLIPFGIGLLALIAVAS